MSVRRRTLETAMSKVGKSGRPVVAAMKQHRDNVGVFMLTKDGDGRLMVQSDSMHRFRWTMIDYSTLNLKSMRL
jgi:hypothetical protein